MTPEQSLREKPRKIEALSAGAATDGERGAAGAAADRIRSRLGRAAGKEESIEAKFSISDMWSRRLFVALCRRYGLHPFRHRRMHRHTILIRAPGSFVEQAPWPEFEELSTALSAVAWAATAMVRPRAPSLGQQGAWFSAKRRFTHPATAKGALRRAQGPFRHRRRAG